MNAESNHRLSIPATAGWVKPTVERLLLAPFQSKMKPSQERSEKL
jgi:hypothetical protein